MKRTLLTAVTGLLTGAVLNGAPADYSAWTNSLRFTFPGYTRGETLTNFPVALVLSNSDSFSYGQFLSGTNGDLRFADETITNGLNFEIEKWDTNGASIVWVQVPRLSNDTTAIYAFWGMEGQVLPPCATNGATWDALDIGVWHMAQSNALDSTARRFNGTSAGTVAQTNGVIGEADEFDASNDYIAIPDNVKFTLTNAYTASAWIRPDPIANYQSFMGSYTGAYGGFIFTLWNNTNNCLGFWGGGIWRTNQQSIPDNAWSHVAYTRAGSNGTFYVNGKVSSSFTNAVSGGDGGVLNIGAGGAAWALYRWDGRLDEVRLSETARGSNYMWASFLNQASNAAFVSVSGWTNLIRNTPATGLSDTAAVLNAVLRPSSAALSTVTACWGTNDGTTAAWEFSETLAAPQEAGPLSLPVSGLLPNQAYFFTFRATNDTGAYQAVPSLGFKTFGPPAADNAAGATAVLYDSAVLNGTLLDGTTAAVSFAWGEAPGALSNTTAALAVPEGPFSIPLSGLADNTAYFYRAYATNDYGAAWAESVAAFTTLNARLVWTGNGSNNLASNPTNWSTGLRPGNGANILLDATSGKHLTWDLTNVTLQSWQQDLAYTGTVTLQTRFPGQGAFSNLVITGSCTVEGGAWTHPLNTGGAAAYDRLAVSVGGDFTLGTGAVITAAGKGYANSQGPGAGYDHDWITYGDGRGGSHGGLGGYFAGGGTPAGKTYGSIRLPVDLGSGGYMAGGGAVELRVAGTATLNGPVTVSAVNNVNRKPGAAGGSILLVCGAAAGSATLSANGTGGGAYEWAGGGGRISVIVTNAASFGALKFQAFGGDAAVDGGAGTVYLESAANAPECGRLIVNNNGIVASAAMTTPLLPDLDATPLPELANPLAGMALVITNYGRASITKDLRMGDLAAVYANSFLHLQDCTLFLTNAEHAIGSGTVFSQTVGRVVWGDPPVTYWLGVQEGPNGDAQTNLSAYYPRDTAVDLAATPDPGYGFCSWEKDVSNSEKTNAAITVLMDRRKWVRGTFGSTQDVVRTWTGYLNALASNPTNWFGNIRPTTGDVVMLDATSPTNLSWDLNIPLGGWVQTGYAGVVTIMTRYPGQGAFTNLAITGDVTLVSGTWTHPVNTGVALEADRLSVTVDGRFTLGSNAAINVAGRGYAAGRGPGAGNSSQRSAAGIGASHGGRGAYSPAAGAPCYGSATEPVDLGSGAAGAGGGAVKLHVAGPAVVNGSILAYGTMPSAQNPGSAGGSIWLKAASLSGAGLLDASGYSGYQSGGGGRIAVVVTASNDYGNVVMRAYGGPGTDSPFARGAAGTVYRESLAERTLLLNNNNLAVGSTNWYTDLPSGEDLSRATLVLTNLAYAAVGADMTMGNLYLRTNTAVRLFLKGNTLSLRSFYHKDWGAPAYVIYDNGEILWRSKGSLILVR